MCRNCYLEEIRLQLRNVVVRKIQILQISLDWKRVLFDCPKSQETIRMTKIYNFMSKVIFLPIVHTWNISVFTFFYFKI